MTLTPVIALVALLAMLLGETWRVSGAGLVRDAPLAQATATALAMATAWPVQGRPLDSLVGLLGPLLLSLLPTVAVPALRGAWSGLARDIGRTVATVVTAGLLARAPWLDGTSLFSRLADPSGQPGVVAILILLVAVSAVIVPVLGRALLMAGSERSSLVAHLGAELGRHGPLALATASTAAVTAISLPVLGPVALLLFLVPMGVLQPAVTRQRRIRAAQREMLYALSRLTDQAGLTAPGHGTRVARLAVPVAREVGVQEADLADVEAAALLHDIGQVGLTRPIPRGATVEVSALDQRRIAATGAAILARTADLSRLASVVADVGALHHRALDRGDVALPSRVVRVVSAYDDLTAVGDRLHGGQSPVVALERIQRSTPHEYDPHVVQALVRHLERRGVLAAADVARLSAVGWGLES
ncbi:MULTISPECIES: HD-GYP domain-containing protein [unclassified Ornithinimicrobium]|uniref:HD-GYP domain-containing protein n=1 Tax=unclassified Ornithinimicrobium TaxID=2615080 RepID=UPI003853BB90